MIKTTVQTVGFMGAGLILGSRKNQGLCGGEPLATGGHFTVVDFGVGTGVQRTEGSLE